MDLIGRQAAIDALGEKPLGDTDWDLGCRNQWEWDTEILKTMPPAQPERKKGKWIEYNATGKNQWMCSECCAEEKNPKVARFCYWCGAEMERSDNG